MLAEVARRLHIKKCIRLSCGEKGLCRDGHGKIIADTPETLIREIIISKAIGDPAL